MSSGMDRDHRLESLSALQEPATKLDQVKTDSPFQPPAGVQVPLDG